MGNLIRKIEQRLSHPTFNNNFANEVTKNKNIKKDIENYDLAHKGFQEYKDAKNKID